MTSTKTYPLYHPIYENWKEVCEILIPKSELIRSSPNLKLEEIVDELFAKHFRHLFTYYDEKEIDESKSSHVTINEVAPILPTYDDLWIFGYGSLVWKADFPYIDKKTGYIEGYQRRFFQHSIDHRGTHDKPGRVVTLVPTKNKTGRVYGVAYRIPHSEKDEVLAHLDYREKNGYERCTVGFVEFGSGIEFDIIMYIATSENESFAGGDENNLQPIAEQIYMSAGPSGPNREYLYNLAKAMRELFPGVVDDHLYKLERMVKKREKRDHELMDAVKAEIRRVLEDGSVEEMVDKFKYLKKEVQRSVKVSKKVWTVKK